MIQHSLFFKPNKRDEHWMHENSIAALATRGLDGRIAEVLAVYLAGGRPMTDREVMHALGQADPNYVQPAITRMIGDGVLREVGQAADHETGRSVRTAVVV